ncbi:DNA-(apurinic or apyrimidinic site) lyase 2 [Venturia nashicola]|uniref:DNA-(Apurinic or apyrimidinic site) lyase 2 n=1 Tax=Venturia nashicola TaxID=86259 RepID=A0A4Z1NPG9_9PEZI|nr:DNA-(apurinic or apyrimidinic site) lyase 2 [Venturia nashicola]TLD27591.1 DNA-(apurinic or apyrimidinic site) lyase 2 [Venturia nashicola]
MDRSISPPPTKRRKLSPNPHSQPSSPTYLPDNSILRVYAWNINGIIPFLPQNHSQKSITNFFKSKTPTPTSNKVMG